MWEEAGMHAGGTWDLRNLSRKVLLEGVGTDVHGCLAVWVLLLQG